MRFSHPHHFCLFSVGAPAALIPPPPRSDGFFLRIFLYKSPFFFVGINPVKEGRAKGKKSRMKSRNEVVAWRRSCATGSRRKKTNNKRKGQPDPGRDPAGRNRLLLGNLAAENGRGQDQLRYAREELVADESRPRVAGLGLLRHNERGVFLFSLSLSLFSLFPAAKAGPFDFSLPNPLPRAR